LVVRYNGPTQYVADHCIQRPALDGGATLQAVMEIVVDPRDQLTHASAMIALLFFCYQSI
jgi:hypothetical protein